MLKVDKDRAGILVLGDRTLTPASKALAMLRACTWTAQKMLGNYANDDSEYDSRDQVQNTSASFVCAEYRLNSSIIEHTCRNGNVVRFMARLHHATVCPSHLSTT